MAFVTFIVLVGLDQGLSDDKLDFENLAYVFSKSLFLWVFEACVQKLAFFFLNLGNPAFFELLAYTGYKFCILCPVISANFLAGYMASYIVLGLLGACFALFFFRTLRRFCNLSKIGDHLSTVSMNKTTFLLANSAVQVVLIWLLSIN